MGSVAAPVREQITFIDYKDYANVMTEWAYAINKHSTKYRTAIICKKPHQNNYHLKHHYDIESVEHVRERVQRIIRIILSSNYIVLGDFTARVADQHWNGRNILKCIMDKWLHYKLDPEQVKHVKFIMFHPGSDYRKKYDAFNKKRGFFKTLMAPDLYRLSPKSEDDQVIWPICTVALSYPEEMVVRSIRRRFELDKLIIFHCPSNPELKGSNIVTNIVKAVVAKFPRFSYIELTNQPHATIMKHRMTATIHIDQFFPSIGTFGVSSIESLLFGNIVLSSDNNIIPETHQKAMDLTSLRVRNVTHDPTNQRPPVISTGITDRLFKKALETICSKTDQQLLEMCLSNLKWARTWLTPQYTVSRWERILSGSGVRNATPISEKPQTLPVAVEINNIVIEVNKENKARLMEQLQEIEETKQLLIEQLRQIEIEETKIEGTKIEGTKIEETKIEETKIEETKIEEIEDAIFD